MGLFLISCPLAQMPCRMTSDPQGAYEEMGASISRQPPQSRWGGTPGLLTAANGFPPSSSPALGNSQRDMSATGDATHICLFAMVPAVPEAEGSERPLAHA